MNTLDNRGQKADPKDRGTTPNDESHLYQFCGDYVLTNLASAGARPLATYLTLDNNYMSEQEDALPCPKYERSVSTDGYGLSTRLSLAAQRAGTSTNTDGGST